jgi:hypothetical protein
MVQAQANKQVAVTDVASLVRFGLPRPGREAAAVLLGDSGRDRPDLLAGLIAETALNQFAALRPYL